MTIALPFHSQLNTSDDYQTATASPSAAGYGKDDAQMLPFFGIAFQGIFRVRMGIRLALFVIDLSFFQYLPYLFFGDVAAVHPASGMAGEDEMADMSVHRVAARLTCLSTTDKQHHQQPSQ